MSRPRRRRRRGRGRGGARRLGVAEDRRRPGRLLRPGLRDLRWARSEPPRDGRSVALAAGSRPPASPV